MKLDPPAILFWDAYAATQAAVCRVVAVLRDPDNGPALLIVAALLWGSL